MNRDYEFGTGYVLSILKVQFTVELVKCTLLLNRLLVLQIYCCVVVVVNTVLSEQRLCVWYWLCAEYIEGAVDSRTGKLYIAVKQIAGPTDILLCCWCFTVVSEQRL